MASTTKSPTSARPAAKRKKTTRSTSSGRLAIAILGGLAIGLIAMTIYGMRDSGSDWAFNRPDAKLPSLQYKHTLQ
jgi:hypothetical protein